MVEIVFYCLMVLMVVFQICIAFMSLAGFTDPVNVLELPVVVVRP